MPWRERKQRHLSGIKRPVWLYCRKQGGENAKRRDRICGQIMSSLAGATIVFVFTMKAKASH
jgi:hypothetical protein